MSDCIIIGAAIVDIPLAPVSPETFSAHSTPLERIAMGVGGDAANEALVLARLGHRPALVSVLGKDAPGDFVGRTLSGAGVDVSAVAFLIVDHADFPASSSPALKAGFSFDFTSMQAIWPSG